MLAFLHATPQVVATASAVSRANMATSDWLRPFDFDQVFWSAPGENRKAKGQEASAKSTATQRSVYEGLGERIVEDVLNVSRALVRGSGGWKSSQ